MTDHEVVYAMEHYGGSFARALAQVCYRADPANLAKIKATWPEMWEEYTGVARLVAERLAPTSEER